MCRRFRRSPAPKSSGLLLKYGTSTPNDFGKVYVLPPGVPADRAAALEAAFASVFKDKELRADADKGRLEIDPLIGNSIQNWSPSFSACRAT